MTNQTMEINSNDLHELLIDDAKVGEFWIDLSDDDEDGVIIETYDRYGSQVTTWLRWLSGQTYVVDSTTGIGFAHNEQITVNDILDLVL